MGNKKLNLLELFSIGVGGMIGGGIFAVLGLSIALSGKNAPLAFLIAGIIALLTGYTYSKLSRRFPSRGGTTEYIIKAFGNNVFSGAMNIMLIISYIIMISLYAYAFGSYAQALLHIPKHLAITLVIIIFTIINALGVYTTGKTEDALVLFKVSILLLLVGVGLIGIKHNIINNFIPHQSILNILVGGMIIFLAYEGFELISNASSEADPKDVYKSFYLAILFVIFIYVLVAIVSVNSLPLKEIIRAKDYALAVVAKPFLGELGFILISIAALASTASAINATLFGTAGITYLISKYGELPKFLEKVVWKHAYEGLLMISLVSLITSNLLNLEEISLIGSAGFLLIFLLINISGFILSRQAKINRVVSTISIVLSFIALLTLLVKNIEINPMGVYLFLLAIAGSFVIEYVYRKISKREISYYVDKNLERREILIDSWKDWIKKVVHFIKEKYPGSEVYLIGGLARNERETSNDVDILVLSKEGDLLSIADKILNKFKSYPLDIHIHNLSDKNKVISKYGTCIKL